MPRSRSSSLYTVAIHAGERPCPATGALATPIYQTSTFVFESAEAGAAIFAGEREGYIYTRLGNPTLVALESKIAALEHTEAALATASGMAAVASAILTLACAGDHVVACDSLYSGTYSLLTRRLRALGIDSTLVDGVEARNIERAIRKNTKLIYIETPGNPTLKVIDMAAVAKLGQSAGIPTVIDNNFASPCCQEPAGAGIDVIVHSATKYLCGHGDAIGGLIAGRREFIERTSGDILRDFGGVMSPFNAWLILRGIKTLPLRVERHSSNALRVATFLEGNPQVERVLYPGLASHPQHDTAARQMRGFGGMICFEVKGGVQAGRELMNRLKLCTLAVSLGDTATLITHPASMTHCQVPRQERLQMGITDGLVRLSVGLEDPEDIIADLDQALSACAPGIS